ncbi:MAG: PHP domain-containing protein [Clostridia bacterium]|nr:PHP domain-containing protein [Clostridia bacterium]
MKLYYDFHIHSCLSPCGDNDMTPNNLVNMAKLLGLDAIALTDHNTCGNCAATAEVAKQAGLLFLPGMELCTAEEIHVICLFPTVAAAEAFEESLAPFPFVENRPEIFGEQRLCNTKDEIVGCEERLLTVASSMSIDNVAEAVNAFGGVAFPAHIDRPSYSITAALGDIPPLGFTAAELTITADKEQYLKQYPLLQTMTLLTDSDAHYLENMPESTPYIEIAEATPEAVIALLKQRSHIRTR